VSTASDGAAPQWLLDGELAMCPCGCIGKRRKGSFVDKTIAGATGLLRQAMFNEDIAEQKGLLQRLDPRVKLLSLIALLFVAAFVRHIPVLLGMYALTLVLAAASGLKLGWFIKRVWLFIPIFTGIVVLPATFSFITPGNVVVGLGHWFGHEVGLTQQGLTSAGLIVSRVATSISLVVLLTITTRWTELLAALRALRLPAPFVLIIGMTYRYIFALSNVVSDMFTARKARTIGSDDDVKAGRAFVAASAGTLFGKAHGLSEEVHQAMVSRGYRGNARSLAVFRVGTADILWMAVCVASAIVILGGDRAIGH